MKPFFKLHRLGPRGPDSHKHTFCVEAVANRSARMLGGGGRYALLNGASDSSGSNSREAVQKLVDALNEEVDRYFRIW